MTKKINPEQACVDERYQVEVQVTEPTRRKIKVSTDRKLLTQKEKQAFAQEMREFAHHVQRDIQRRLARKVTLGPLYYGR